MNDTRNHSTECGCDSCDTKRNASNNGKPSIESPFLKTEPVSEAVRNVQVKACKRTASKLP